jgi:hypothetical protein
MTSTPPTNRSNGQLVCPPGPKKLYEVSLSEEVINYFIDYKDLVNSSSSCPPTPPCEESNDVTVITQESFDRAFFSSVDQHPVVSKNECPNAPTKIKKPIAHVPSFGGTVCLLFPEFSEQDVLALNPGRPKKRKRNESDNVPRHKIRSVVRTLFPGPRGPCGRPIPSRPEKRKRNFSVPRYKLDTVKRHLFRGVRFNPDELEQIAEFYWGTPFNEFA